jgi:hypothetical protein
MTDERITPEQQKCDDEVGHDWEHFAYEPDTNAGGYKQCKLCGYCESDEGYDGGDFDDNYI